MVAEQSTTSAVTSVPHSDIFSTPPNRTVPVHLLGKRANAAHCFACFFAVMAAVERDKLGDRSAAARDDDFLAVLRTFEELGQLILGLECSDLRHDDPIHPS